jgi:hypothetical protein
LFRLQKALLQAQVTLHLEEVQGLPRQEELQAQVFASQVQEVQEVEPQCSSARRTQAAEVCREKVKR